MKASSLNELKLELQELPPKRVLEIALRLGRFKKENKELLSYLLFEAQDEQGYIKNVKEEIEELFATINLTQLYFAKKTIRKILRVINKHSRYSGNKQTDLELRIFFCRQLKDSGIPFRQNAVLSNMFDGQLKKIHAALSTLHEDLQHDYRKEIPG